MRQRDRQRHQLFGLIARKTEHQSLVACPAGVHAHGDVRGLPLDRGNHGAGFGVEAVLGARVADVADDVAGNVGIIEHGLGGDFTGDHHQARRHQRFARHAPHGIFREHRVEYRVRNLIGNLVRVTFGHRFRCKQKFAFVLAQASTSLFWRLHIGHAIVLNTSAWINQLKIYEVISNLRISTLAWG